VTTQLEFCYAHEKERPDRVWLTQPLGGGASPSSLALRAARPEDIAGRNVFVRDFTWRQVMDEARRVATYLRARGFPPKSQIALWSKNSAWWIISDLAIWMAGHVTVPLYPTLTAETIRQIINHSEAKLVIVGKLDGFDRMKAGIPEGMPIVTTPLAPLVEGATKWEDVLRESEPLEENTKRDEDELATIVYTSGSTGVPKGVMHSFRTMCTATMFLDIVHLRSEDRVLSYLPLAHVMERAAVEIPSMKVGTHIYFAESLDTFLDDLRRARPTMFMSVPRLWSKFQQGIYSKIEPKRLQRLLSIPIVKNFIRKRILGGLGLDQVRYAASGSAPLAEDLWSFWGSLGLELLEGYGMTENFAISHGTRPGEARIGYIGRPHDGVEQRITEQGEIWVKSPGTMLGYFKAPDLTKEILDDEGFLHTGDRGVLDEKKRLKVTGRVKELFKTSKGKYVAPAPIENVLMEHADVEQAMVAGAGMPQPFGMVVLSEAARKRAKDDMASSLAAHLKKTNAALDPHEHLQKLVVLSESWTIENGLLTPTMKVKRDAIEKRYADKVSRWYDDEPTVLWD
jgi:long-subunit acyl-CoA synthetase (AMP-forming)